MKSKVIHRGTLTIDKLKELCYEHLELKSESDEWSPKLHKEVITIIRQPDGHFKGFTQIGGVWVESREVAPEHALQALLTHK